MYFALIHTLKMKVAGSSETIVPTYKTRWCHNPDDHNVEQTVTYCVHNFNKQYYKHSMSDGSLVTTAWHILRLQMETTSRYAGEL
jgi:hypothetical protein